MIILRQQLFSDKKERKREDRIDFGVDFGKVALPGSIAASVMDAGGELALDNKLKKENSIIHKESEKEIKKLEKLQEGSEREAKEKLNKKLIKRLNRLSKDSNKKIKEVESKLRSHRQRNIELGLPTSEEGLEKSLKDLKLYYEESLKRDQEMLREDYAQKIQNKAESIRDRYRRKISKEELKKYDLLSKAEKRHDLKVKRNSIASGALLLGSIGLGAGYAAIKKKQRVKSRNEAQKPFK